MTFINTVQWRSSFTTDIIPNGVLRPNRGDSLRPTPPFIPMVHVSKHLYDLSLTIHQQISIIISSLHHIQHTQSSDPNPSLSTLLTQILLQISHNGTSNIHLGRPRETTKVDHCPGRNIYDQAESCSEGVWSERWTGSHWDFVFEFRSCYERMVEWYVPLHTNLNWVTVFRCSA